MRSRSELAVISRAPSRPSATIALLPSRMRPWAATKSSSTLPVHGAQQARRQAAQRPRPPAPPTSTRRECARRSGTYAPGRTGGWRRAPPRSRASLATSRASSASSRASSGSEPKKRGSTSGSMKCGFCARISASRGAVPRMSATKRIRSGFCRNSEKKRPPARSPARNRSNVAKAASGFSAREN